MRAGAYSDCDLLVGVLSLVEAFEPVGGLSGVEALSPVGALSPEEALSPLAPFSPLADASVFFDGAIPEAER
jgi:hypothetical protein